jgi:hypothetical protein
MHTPYVGLAASEDEVIRIADARPYLSAKRPHLSLEVLVATTEVMRLVNLAATFSGESG